MAQNEGSADEAPNQLRQTVERFLYQFREFTARILSVLLGSFLLTLGTAGLVLVVLSLVWFTGVDAGIFGTIGLAFSIFPYSIYALLWVYRYKL
jgi:uncharacterized membrane protein